MNICYSYVLLLKNSGFISNNLSPERIILGDLGNSPMFSFLLLTLEKVIYNAIRVGVNYFKK